MCWPHTDRNIEHHCKGLSEEFRKEIDSDIDEIQLMYSKETFEHAIKLFNMKWRGKDCDKVNAFLDYFEKVWIRVLEEKPKLKKAML